ncbi:PIN domain-containing protein [Vulcanisaeta souniana]|uniref:PIN domain nuclease n=1 Tax=Vulcanisaeta souniana JCM 11219 TaxID=1293586 RepID=A0A830ECQ0_9CREN|nr:PIN domain-containing protein [Vulcanisaeta souniana]BDR91869.1 PIN domain nuclease [Vulcanisaeta souniana JCM 11219]GGI69746.1 PIN domain nuclease [Vulcanisaeta souniana JCM 11219]
MSFVVDTNFIVAVISEDDVSHDKAVSLWDSLNEAYVPIIVIAELSYFFIRHKIDVGIISEILRDSKIKVVENNVQDIYFAIDHKDYIRHYDDFNDLIVLSTARRLGLPLITFDDELLDLYHKLKS